MHRGKSRWHAVPRLAVGLVACLALRVAAGADWPRLGGPEGTGVSPETGLARAWPAGGPRVLWSVDVGEGFAGPAVQGGEVFLLDRVADQRDVLRCFDLPTGRELWRLACDAPGTLPYNGSRNVPTVDAHRVFTVGPFGHFRCVDRQTRQVVWSRHLVNDFKDPQVDRPEPPQTRDEKLARAQVPTWGLTQAPWCYRDLVIVAPQTQTTGLIACEQATGKIRWQSGYIGRNWYSHVSPVGVTLGGVEQVLMLAQPSDPEKAPRDAPPAIISSVDPLTGRILWTNTTPRPHKIPVPQPVRVADDRLFITGGYGLGCLMLHAAPAPPDGRWETRVLFHNKSVAGHIHSPVVYRDRIYVSSLKSQGATHSGLVCLNADGDVLWQTGPALSFDDGALLLADGLALVLHGRTGELHLLALADAGPEVLAKAKVLAARNGKVWAPMALSQGKLLVRDQHQMKCLELRP